MKLIIDGNAVGKTPYSGYVEFGNHKLKFIKEGSLFQKNNFKRKINIKSNNISEYVYSIYDREKVIYGTKLFTNPESGYSIAQVTSNTYVYVIKRDTKFPNYWLVLYKDKKGYIIKTAITGV